MRGKEESASSRKEKCLRGWGGRREAQGEGHGARGAGRAWDARREAQGVGREGAGRSRLGRVCFVCLYVCLYEYVSVCVCVLVCLCEG